jgi:ribosomal protein S18 acetylase RimI-like enzyme
MLDYTLVSTRATYRMLQPADVPAFLALVGICHRSDPPGSPIPQERILATFRELQHNKDRGTLFVFEREQALVGYSILTTTWSNRFGGLVLAVDELHVHPDFADSNLGQDFLQLVAKVAPAEVRALQVTADSKDRRTLGAYRKLGFRDSGRTFLLLRLPPS